MWSCCLYLKLEDIGMNLSPMRNLVRIHVALRALRMKYETWPAHASARDF